MNTCTGMAVFSRTFHPTYSWIICESPKPACATPVEYCGCLSFLPAIDYAAGVIDNRPSAIEDSHPQDIDFTILDHVLIARGTVGFDDWREEFQLQFDRARADFGLMERMIARFRTAIAT